MILYTGRNPAKMKVQYKIVQGSNLRQLEEDVNKYAEEGWDAYLMCDLLFRVLVLMKKTIMVEGNP